MKQDNPHIPGPRFPEAAMDYLCLLDRGYSQKSVLKLVGDRYLLTTLERSLLYRGISPQADAARRRRRIASENELSHNSLYIDGFNTLITIGSYLNGNLVFESMDGVLRDASEVHGKAFRGELLDKALLLVFSFLEQDRPAEVHFCLDEPMSHSGDLCQKINALLGHYGIQGSAFTSGSPDKFLKTIDSGLVATSDSAIMDHSKVPIFDLALHVLEYHYHPVFLQLDVKANFAC